MALTEEQAQFIESFRVYVEDAVQADDRYGSVTRHDREDGSALTLRFEAGPTCWLEVAVRPIVPEVRVSFLTNDPLKSEEVEQAIQDTGDSMAEVVAGGFGAAGLDWDKPPVEQYCEAGESFYFATPLELDELADLEWPKTRDKVVRMLEGYLVAFGSAIVMEDIE
ncbi:MAG: hypothetical protein IH987_19440 [Planctomycetes bacterium]|nr:hypothetical protein [Planctomycetota bacterium]